MPARLNLHRVFHPDEKNKPWLFNSLVSLAHDRPDLYQINNWVSGGAAPDGAIYTVSSVGPLQQIAWVLSNVDVRQAVSSGSPLVIDDSGEAGLMRGSLPELEKAIRNSGLAKGLIIITQQNENFPSSFVIQTSEGEVEIRVVILHYWMHRLRKEFVPPPPFERARDARFLCLNNKLRPHRAMVLGWLRNTGLVDRGIVSLGEQKPGTPAFDWPSWDAFRGEALRIYPGSEQEIDAVVPMLETPVFQGDPYARSQRIPHDLHAQTGFSLVNETESTSGDVRRFTEKVLKPLASRHPFIVVGNPGTLGLLHRLGFRTFSSEIDESYDNVVCMRERLTRVMQVAETLIQMPEQMFNDMLSRLEPVLNFNTDHFANGLPAVMEAQHLALLNAVKREAVA